jgi:hypothetical protein
LLLDPIEAPFEPPDTDPRDQREDGSAQERGERHDQEAYDEFVAVHRG